MNDPAVSWLMKSADPSVRYLTMTEVLGYRRDSDEVEAVQRSILQGPKVRALLSGQLQDGGFGVHPYQKWTGAHWRLVSLAELAIPKGNPQAARAANQVLDWLASTDHKEGIKTIRGLTRRCASQEGNALGACSYIGLGRDPRVEALASSLATWQWPDGGWNCDKKPYAHHSSFNESLATLWGLALYQDVTGDREAARAIDRASEFFLSHHLFRSHRTGEVIKSEFLELHYPLYWHYDILQALRVLSLTGKLGDPRAKEALDLVESKRREDGLWHSEGSYWRSLMKGPAIGARTPATGSEVVDWGRSGASEMITLNALRVLNAAGRLR